MTRFRTARLPPEPDERAPDGCNVRLLLGTDACSMAHFELDAGATSVAVAHRSVEEVWYFLSGRGEMWRRDGGAEEVVAVHHGVCVTIPAGTAFQLRSIDGEPLSAVAVTIPPWPGAHEAGQVPGRWPASVQGAKR